MFTKVWPAPKLPCEPTLLFPGTPKVGSSVSA